MQVVLAQLNPRGMGVDGRTHVSTCEQIFSEASSAPRAGLDRETRLVRRVYSWDMAMNEVRTISF